MKIVPSMIAVALGLCVVPGFPASANELPGLEPQPSVATTEVTAADSPTSSDEQPPVPALLKPRFQLHVPSVRSLIQSVQGSAAGKIVQHVRSMIDEFGNENGNGVDREAPSAVWNALRTWPDTPLDFAMFAADREGLTRWSFRVDLPIGQLHDLLVDIVDSDTAEEFFSGTTLEVVDGGWVAEVNGNAVAHLRAHGTNQTVVSSHADLELPDKFFPGTEGDGPVLMAAELDWTNTEKDSGATLFSKFNVVTTVDYTVRVGSQSHWVDELRVNWPPVAGMTLKALLGRTRQSFFVPDEAFMALSFNAMAAQALLDASVGLVDGEDMEDGVLQGFAGSDICVAILPGRGFFPVPDVVTQCRITDADGFLDAMQVRIKQLNRKARKADRRPTWKRTTVRGHTVFWNNRDLQANGLTLPVSMRSVLFVQSAADAKGRERDFLVVAATSTDPAEFVEHWLDQPRAETAQFLPSSSGSNGELWVHWQQVFDQIEPYLNLSLVALSSDAVLPAELGEKIPPGRAVARLKYEGLRLTHQGPVPLGILVLPSMFSASLQESTGTDLARERVASRRLKVLYHHCHLFWKDTGRWPVEAAELDGYVDFAGHPELLKLKVSPKKRWSKWLESLLKSETDDQDSEEDDVDDELYADIDDSLYVVEWRDDVWTLGIAPGMLDHLDELYIDQDGQLHRVVASVKSAAPAATAEEN